MDHKVHISPNGIPLHCNICPRKPVFSDTSHLLTHIASKAHLSNYYKMEVKGSTDPSAKDLVDEYDDWYDEWNVQDLMRERMNQKERKKGGVVQANGTSNSRRGPRATPLASGTPRGTPLPPTNIAGRRPSALRESTIDPQLGVRIKVEPKSRSTTPAGSFGSLDAATMHRSYAPPMQTWPPLYDNPLLDNGGESIMGSVYSTPSSGSRDTDMPRQSNGRKSRRNPSESNHSLVIDEEAEFDDGSAENTKLKGVLWDGMGMFDSATPDMRRKRNQKKATSVVEFLQATSETVEATECVFDAEGLLRRERPITGNPLSDDGYSPLKGESSPEPEFPVPKKKAGRRPRPALFEKDVNTNRPARRQGGSHQPVNRRTPYFDGAEEDDELTYGRPRQTRRTGLSIHRDNSGPDITFDHPAALNTLTAEFRNPLQSAHGPPRRPRPNQATYQNGFLGRGHQRQPSFPYDGGLRQTNTNPLNVPPPPNFGSFGQLNSQSMFQNANLHGNPFPGQNGNQAVAPFQQQFGINQTAVSQDNFFFAHGQNHPQTQIPWDIFGLGPQNMSMQPGAEVGFHANNDFGSMNPLFFSSNQGGDEDDEGTVSPPASQGRDT